MKFLIRAKVDTIIKRYPIDSSILPNGQKRTILAGTEILAVNCAIVPNNHISFLTFQDNNYIGKWYAFAPHVEAFNDGKLIVSDLVAKDQAEYIFENKIFDNELADLNHCLKTFGITNKEDIRMFLAQCGHESGGLKWLKELATGDDYEWRSDLGNNKSGDGRRFKGSGVIQLTGRSNYQDFANYTGDHRIMEGVDYVANTYPFSSAGFWWMNNKMSKFIANGATIQQVSTRVNGANPANGLSDRIKYYERAKVVIL